MRRPIRKPYRDDPNDTKKGHFQSRNEATHTTILWPPLLHVGVYITRLNHFSLFPFPFSFILFLCLAQKKLDFCTILKFGP